MPNWGDQVWFLTVFGVTAWLVLGLVSAGHAVMYKRDPRSAALWIIISFALPILGPWLYWVIGINRFQRRASRIFGVRVRPFVTAGSAPSGAVEAMDQAVGHLVPLRRMAERITRLPLLPGNEIQPLHNGEQAYPAMLEAIAGARSSVTLASYIFDWDELGQSFCDALGAAARRGVAVQVLLDGIGAVHSWSRVGRRLLKSGAEVASFFPLRFPLGRIRINLRNHRKILVVDGRTGFTGGMNISRRHFMATTRPDRVEDLHFQVVGPVVGEMQHVFLEDWLMATGRQLEGEAYLPPLAEHGSALCRGIASGPDEDSEKIHWLLLAAFAAAQDSVRVVTPYFVPTAPLIKAMVMASLRGVRVTLVLPSFLDLPAMRWVADSYLWQLLEHGVRVYRRPPPFVHTKLLIVDDRWVLLGSANLDPRSLRLNFEFNVESYDIALATSLSTWLDSLLVQGEEVTLASVDARGIPQRLRDGAVKLFSPYL